MNTRRRAGSVMTLAVCLALVPDPNPVPAAAQPPGGGENTITITVVDMATTGGSANIAGTYTTKPGVTLTAVTGYLYPVAGGIVSSGGGDKQNPAVKITVDPQQFTSVIVDDPTLTAQTYACRVAGTFSDGSEMQSAYMNATAKGGIPSNSVTVNWTANHPKSTAPKTIDSAGTYTGFVDRTKGAFVLASKTAGGPTEPVGGISFDPNPNIKTWSTANHKVGSGSTAYSAIALMNQGAGNTYCSPIGGVTTAP
jgi:hypothetical protein